MSRIRHRLEWTTRAGIALTAALALIVTMLSPAARAEEVQRPEASGQDHYVASWATAPTDSVSPIDANFGPTPTAVYDQSFRMAVNPHMGGDNVRVRLSNRYGVTPVTFGTVTVGKQESGPEATSLTQVTFNGASEVTLQPGEEAVSDGVNFTFATFEPLLISAYVDGAAGPATQHWNANATSYLSPAGSGDLASQASGDGFSISTGAWNYVTGLDVLAPQEAGAIVAFGDSITDGFVGTSQVPIPADSGVNDTNHRYPDALQRRLSDAGDPISVVNAGIGSNQLLVSGEPLFLGAAGVDRFHRDALDLPGVYGAIVLIGINDLGLNPFVTTEAMIDGYKDLIGQARASGKKIWLGTILPASDALVDGTLLSPESDRIRTEINSWIREQDLADGYVDFDAALRDPENPSVLRADYSGPDRLHPSPAGYQAMAEAVDLAMIRR